MRRRGRAGCRRCALALAFGRRRGRSRTRVRSSSTAATTPTPASSPRRRSRATPASPARIVRKPTGEFYAQIRAERDNPKGDVWYGGTLDPFLQGAAEGLFAPYRSPRLAELHPWARRQARRRATASSRSTGSSSASAAIRRCWRRSRCRRRAAGADLVKPEYRGEIELSNPVTSGTGYTILATLVALYGEDGAFAYLKRARRRTWSATRSRAPRRDPSVARGEVGVGVALRPRVRHPAARRLCGRHRHALRGHRRRAGRHGDHRRRAATRPRRGVLRLGADRAPRRSSPTARAT